MMTELDTLLAAHAAAWWRSTHEPDFVEQVNATYDAYIEAGGNDKHYDARWRAASDRAKAAADLTPPLPPRQRESKHEADDGESTEDEQAGDGHGRGL